MPRCGTRSATPHAPCHACPQVRQLCAGVAQHLPEYVLAGMVLELLQVDLQAGERCSTLRVV